MPERAAAASSPPSRASLGALAALAGAMALWSLALFLGPTAAAVKTVCGVNDGGGCGVLWRSPFALAVWRATSVSVAGWGVVWGLAGLGLAVTALVRASRRRPSGALVTALRGLAAAGLLAVFVLAAVSVSERTFCAACAVAYVLVVAHAAVALFAWRDRGLPDASDGMMLLAGFVLGAYLVAVFMPGAAAQTTAIPSSAAATSGPGDAALHDFVASLPPPGRQALSDVLGRMRRGPSLPLPPPRALRGDANAPVRFTEFTDVRCSHCAELHGAWEELERALPAGSFSVESRFYPLDAACNPNVRARAADGVRCLAPQAQICLEGQPGARSLAGELFKEQRSLTTERVYALAARHSTPDALRACVASTETARKLADDVALATLYEPEGTPVVLVNGRLGSALPPFLYAIALARGSPDHPAFATLPPPNLNAHIH